MDLSNLQVDDVNAGRTEVATREMERNCKGLLQFRDDRTSASQSTPDREGQISK